MAKNGARRSGLEALTFLVDLIRDFLVRKGISNSEAQLAADEMGRQMADCYGGNLFYFPRDTQGRIEELHRQVVEKFTGHNHVELVAEFGITVSTVYRILKAHHMRTAGKPPAGT